MKWFDASKGFGFIAVDDTGTDVFVDFTEIQLDGFRSLNEGETVAFDLARDRSGVRAVNVTPHRDTACTVVNLQTSTTVAARRAS